MLSEKEKKTYLGCCYIYPSDNSKFEAQVHYWIRKDKDPDIHEAILGNLLRAWIRTSWPFKNVEFPGRG